MLQLKTTGFARPSIFGGEVTKPLKQDRPYMVFVYSQQFRVEGQGTYELKITNVINPYTMKATPL